MRFKEWDDYLNSMLKHVKFTPDRKRIRRGVPSDLKRLLR